MHKTIRHLPMPRAFNPESIHSFHDYLYTEYLSNIITEFLSKSPGMNSILKHPKLLEDQGKLILWKVENEINNQLKKYEDP